MKFFENLTKLVFEPEIFVLPRRQGSSDTAMQSKFFGAPRRLLSHWKKKKKIGHLRLGRE
ncbi:hypothetical protein DP116_17645 [Brasilonema bromeliae SPC951]|uniref:Uncharacterized protein n=1 Tax=Brasilonema bromeliae SPC951 TaxID=385972 RepID=A0ABX1PBM2_9CYAN|nr:hypothetical protein [Brasilonema bromeliae SPC951]